MTATLTPFAPPRLGLRGRQQALHRLRPRCVGERSAPRQRDELLLAALRRRAVVDPLVRPVAAQRPGLEVVALHRREDLADDALLERRVVDREGHVHAPREVALHPVTGSEEDFALAPRLEEPDPRVL